MDSYKPCLAVFRAAKPTPDGVPILYSGADQFVLLEKIEWYSVIPNSCRSWRAGATCDFFFTVAFLFWIKLSKPARCGRGVIRAFPLVPEGEDF